MSEGKPVTVGQVAQGAIQRLGAEAREAIKRERHRDEELRQLLSYCEGQAQHCGSAVDESAYTDIAKKLRGILDGE